MTKLKIPVHDAREASRDSAAPPGVERMRRLEQHVAPGGTRRPRTDPGWPAAPATRAQALRLKEIAG